MIRRHPSSSALRSWLDADARSGPHRLDNHLAVCERCANRLEQIDQSDGRPMGSRTIAAMLAQLLEPSDGFTTRVESGVATRVNTQPVSGILTDLLAIGIETPRLLLSQDEPWRPSP